MRQNLSDEPANRVSPIGNPLRKESDLASRCDRLAKATRLEGARRVLMRRRDPWSGNSAPGARFTCERRFAPDPQPRRSRAHTRRRRSGRPLDQGDIDRKLAVAREEFPRSVERIDQQETLGDLSAALRPPSPPRRTRAARAPGSRDIRK